MLIKTQRPINYAIQKAIVKFERNLSVLFRLVLALEILSADNYSILAAPENRGDPLELLECFERLRYLILL